MSSDYADANRSYGLRMFDDVGIFGLPRGQILWD
jgi:hypothetical protein